MRGILSAAAYVPYRRLDRSEIRATFGKGGGRGQRTVASYDEDATTLAVEAARLALRSAPAGAAGPDALWFATTSPPYLDKTNATAIHAALRLPGDVASVDLGGASLTEEFLDRWRTPGAANPPGAPHPTGGGG